MKDLPETERPYEKCIREGEETLSDSELLSVILRCGTKGCSSLALANNILKHMQESSYPGLPGLIHSSLADLEKMHRGTVQTHFHGSGKAVFKFSSSGFYCFLLHGKAPSSGAGAFDLYDAGQQKPSSV